LNFSASALAASARSALDETDEELEEALAWDFECNGYRTLAKVYGILKSQKTGKEFFKDKEPSSSSSSSSASSSAAVKTSTAKGFFTGGISHKKKVASGGASARAKLMQAIAAAPNAFAEPAELAKRN
jgi:hypothetical protein